MSAVRQPLGGDDAMLLRRLMRAQLRLLEELGGPYGAHPEREAAAVVGGARDVYELLAPEMQPPEHEQLRVLLLDTRHRVLNTVTLYQGTVNQTHARIAELFREAVRANAPAIVLAHNHPTGVREPSPDDIRLTRDAAQAGELLGVELLDHVVIGHGRYVSLKERGVL